jgi:hypothetical protein
MTTTNTEKMATDFDAWALDAEQHQNEMVPVHRSTLRNAATLLRTGQAQAASLAAQLGQANERCEFMHKATREAQQYASAYGDKVVELTAKLEAAKILAPGVMHCARCKFKLIRNTLNMGSGTVTAGDSKTEPCPNGCGPLWPVTWEQEARDAYQTAEDMFNRLQAAETVGRPIATAPKGEEILLFATKHRAHWFMGDWGRFNRHNQPRITHWAPLPPDPVDAALKGQA